MRKREFPEHNYRAVYFNGKTVRIAIDPSKPITELKYPEFLDVKITEKCEGKCPYCYMDSNPEDAHAKNIIKKIESYFGGLTSNQLPFQVAIGGGEPTTHPDFIESLKVFYGMGITPNYTTNGMFIHAGGSCDIIKATKKYCGGVAVSCHDHLDLYWRKAAREFSRAGVRLNFHIIISDGNSSVRFREIYDDWKDIVEYFVLLPYGAQGRAEHKYIDWEYLKSVMPEDTNQIAFGANFHPYLTKDDGVFNVSLYEPESLSKFISFIGKGAIYPSSFHLEPLKENLFIS